MAAAPADTTSSQSPQRHDLDVDLERMTVRDILRQWPATRGPFERAGLMGCGGEQGPDERLDFFASMHQVPLEALRHALTEAIRREPREGRRVATAGGAVLPGAQPARRQLAVAPAPPLLAEPAHRYVPFLLVSVALTLTFGATLGMINLARLTTPYFGAMPPGSVRAHAFAQVFGFVGLFVMGIALHVLPRFAGRPLGAASLTRTVLGLQAGGVMAIAIALTLGDVPVYWLWSSGALALAAAGSMFLVIVVRTIGGLPATERFRRWVIAGAVWQVVAAVGSSVAAWQHDAAITQAVWPASLWGFAGSWIFGVGRRILPGFLGWQVRGRSMEHPAFLLYQIGVGLHVATEWPRVEGPIIGAGVAGALALLIAVPLFSWCLGVGRAPKTYHDVEHGYQRYVTAAWIWLGVALVAGPLWTLAAAAGGRAVPPLGTDFARHALAFGFITQIMMGIATRILPVFTGNALWSPRARSAAFYLLNASIAMRALEAVVALGFMPVAWPFIALAGPPAVAAVVLFALNVVFTLYGRPAASVVATVPTMMADRRVSDILVIPGALEVLIDAGFTPLRNPVMRSALAGSVTLRQACSLKDVPLDPLVSRLQGLPRTT
jgi:hypothetical protein